VDNPRPTSVTVISIIVIVLNSLSVFGLSALLALFSLMAARPEIAAANAQFTGRGGVTFIMGVGLVESLIGLVLAIYMLKGCNWARQLFLMFQGAGIIVGWILVGFRAGSVVGILIFGVCIYFLTRPDAVAYFTYEPSTQVEV
jgi:uncharacterized membrane protein